MNMYKPFIGVNNLKFGKDRESLRAIFNFKQKEFLRNEFAENTTDFFVEEEFFLEFDKGNKLQAIEFTEDSELWLDEINILKIGF